MNPHDVVCPYCGHEAKFASSRHFYGMDYKTNVYYCDLCDARVGTHKGSTKPLGTMANAQLRVLRTKCHAFIDPYWKKGKYSRSTVYKRMAKAMNLAPEDTHIGMFDEAQCRQLIEFFKKG